MAFGFHEGVQKSPGHFTVDSVTPVSYNSSGYITQMDVEMSYVGGSSNLTHVYFRIFQDTAIVNGNMFLWLSANNTLLVPGDTYNLAVIPQYKNYSLNPAVGSMLVAYYGDVQGSYYLQGTG